MIDKKWKWVARDEDGRTFVFTKRPIAVGPAWGCSPAFLAVTDLFNLKDDWEESLHEIIHHEDGKIEFRKARPELKVDDPVFVRDRDGEGWKRRHFAQWGDTGGIEVWPYGHTSFTAPEDEELPVFYLQYKLP